MPDEPTMFMVTCACGQKMKAPAEAIGKTHRCVRCGEPIELTRDRAVPLGGGGQPNPPEPPEPGPDNTADTGEQAPIGQLLIRYRLITPEHLEEALDIQKREGGKILSILLNAGHLDKYALHGFLSRQSGVPSIDLKNYEIPWELLDLIPEEIVRESLVLPIDRLGRLLTVAMACPLDRATIAKVEEHTGLRVKPMLCDIDDIHAVIEERYREMSFEEPQAVPAFSLDGAVSTASPATEDTQAPPAPPGDVAGESGPQSAREPAAAAASPEDTEALLAALKALPAVPGTAARVRKVLERSNGTAIRAILDVIRTDPPVAAGVLQLANAAGYEMPGEVGDLALAALLLGVEGLCEVVMAVESAGAARATAAIDIEAVAGEAAFCAQAARELARAVDPAMAERAFAAGLLLDLGRLALGTVYPDKYPRMEATASPVELVAAEAAHCGLDHPAAGAYLLGHWRVPSALVEAIRYHHDPAAAAKAGPLGAVVAVAAQMADFQFGRTPDSGDPLGASTETLNALGLKKAAAVRAFEAARRTESASY